MVLFAFLQLLAQNTSKISIKTFILNTSITQIYCNFLIFIKMASLFKKNLDIKNYKLICKDCCCFSQENVLIKLIKRWFTNYYI
jgi:hypothetical protein